MKRLAWLVIIVLLASATRSTADSICFEEPTARKLLTDLEVGEQSAQSLAVCDSLTGILKAETIQQAAKIAALEKDKAALTEVSGEYRGLAEKGNEALTACEVSKPSRLTWFALGAASALLSIVGAYAATR